MKNMKLTNLSLSVLIALGLVACGGSDDKGNAPEDKNPPPGIGAGNGGNGGSGSEATVPEAEKTGTKPQRYEPTLNVPDDLKGQVAARKRFVVRRGFADPALGYSNTDPYNYQKALNTDPADIKRTSIYNYADEKDLIVVSADGNTATGGFKPKAKGAISIGIFDKANFNQDGNKLNAWVKGVDGYYRVRPNDTFDDYSKDTEFSTVAASGATKVTLGGKDPAKIKQSDIVFIANADYENVDKLELSAANMYILGNAGKQKEVILDEISVFNNTFGVQQLSQNLDLSLGKLPVNKDKIQVEDIIGKYHLLNTKGTAYNDDDKTIDRTAVLGKIKAYNLPHSIAFVTTNAKMDDQKNVFNLDGNGAFQLNGLQTPSLPKDGRAIYAGKSFSATVEGNVELVADFFENEAGILGRVYDRKETASGDDLPELTLGKITLSDPSYHRTQGYGSVVGDSNYADQWFVQLYGVDAQEAGGFLGKQLAVPAQAEIKEVYTSQRKKLGPQSNDNTVK